MISAREALLRLKEGNQRFASGRPADEARVSPSRREGLARQQQEPFAIVVGCSDSRAPVEIVLGQGLGDLFVIRVAGNIIAPSQLESVEFAASNYGPKLVVVLGHSGCGAVTAAVSQLRRPAEASSRSLGLLIKGIRPAVEGLLADQPDTDDEALVRFGVRANIGSSVDLLQQDSAILPRLIHDEGLVVIGAEYSLESGLVEWLGEAADV